MIREVTMYRVHRETHSRAFLWFIRFFWYGLGLMSGWMTVHAH